TLEYIDAQQVELSGALEAYEKIVRGLYEGDKSGVQGAGGREPIRNTGADEEREKAYLIAEGLNRQVDEMARQLGDMITEVNGVHGNKQEEVGGGSAVSKIVRILDTHLTSLQWLDTQAEELAGKVAEVRRKGESAVGEAERVHQRSQIGSR
ncbi:FG-nucleoporin nsp1, partial [Rhizoclosmatium hyalinum]